MKPCYSVKRSSIHGRGLFAARRICSHAQIGIYEGPATTRDGRYVLWYPDEEGRECAIRGTNSLRFVNHSLAPNAEFQGAELFAIGTIEPGAEITIHYGDDWE